MIFECRESAGELLAERLQRWAGPQTVVLGLPRGGVIVAAAVARRLHAALGLLITRKIGHPEWAEYAIGAVTETGAPVWNKEERPYVSDAWAKQAVREQREEARRRRLAYDHAANSALVRGKTVIVVDDGAATGLTLLAGINELKQYHPARIVVALPVAPREVVDEIAKHVDRVVVLLAPSFGFSAVGAYYRYFQQVSDEEVLHTLQQVAASQPA